MQAGISVERWSVGVGVQWHNSVHAESDWPKSGIIGEDRVVSPVCSSEDRYWCLKKTSCDPGSPAAMRRWWMPLDGVGSITCDSVV